MSRYRASTRGSTRGKPVTDGVSKTRGSRRNRGSTTSELIKGRKS